VSVTTASSWEREFLELLPLIERIVEFVARRHYLSTADAEDFSSEVKVKLIENDYAILRKFEGRSSMRTFLTTVISHACLDYRNSEWGKWRPSAEARRGGPDAILLERLLVRDGLPLHDAFDIMTTNHGVTRSRAELEEMAARFPVRFRRRFEPEDALLSVPSPGRADGALQEQERQAAWDRTIGVLRALQDKLDARDALILAMRFQDGRKVSEIAQVLQIDARPLYERVYKLLDQLRTGLEALGIDVRVVRDLMEDRTGQP
jgi:RNA polymerase sigma factor for flagellar operon FliA